MRPPPPTCKVTTLSRYNLFVPKPLSDLCKLRLMRRRLILISFVCVSGSQNLIKEHRCGAGRSNSSLHTPSCCAHTRLFSRPVSPLCTWGALRGHILQVWASACELCKFSEYWARLSCSVADYPCSRRGCPVLWEGPPLPLVGLCGACQ